jgi:hypothetical protein
MIMIMNMNMNMTTGMTTIATIDVPRHDSLDSAPLRRRLYLDEAVALRAQADRTQSEEEREHLILMAAQYEQMAVDCEASPLLSRRL